jgi:hypothetical protein
MECEKILEELKSIIKEEKEEKDNINNIEKEYKNEELEEIKYYINEYIRKEIKEMLKSRDIHILRVINIIKEISNIIISLRSNCNLILKVLFHKVMMYYNIEIEYIQAEDLIQKEIFEEIIKEFINDTIIIYSDIMIKLEEKYKYDKNIDNNEYKIEKTNIILLKKLVKKIIKSINKEL